jgi:phenylacetic acid degradation operon negative regulatory protein
MIASSRRLGTFRRVVLDAPVSYSVYSAFSFYGSRRGNELPGTWLVAALSALGHDVAAIRQTLYRMESSAVLLTRSVGRNKFYRLSAGARAEAEAGLEKIMAAVTPAWDRQWTIVQLSADGEERSGKELAREVLRAEGFARIGPNLFLHPCDRSARLVTAAQGHGIADMVTVFRGARAFPADDGAFARSIWDLDVIAAGYRRFIRRYQSLDARTHAVDDVDAFVIRFALVFDYLETAWKDPDLPPELLPDDWTGPVARRLAKSLYQRLLPQALAYGDQLSKGAS